MEASLEPKTDRKNLVTQQKALAINLDPRKYGTFAEIGAGQEVVRWFFQVGGAAGTIAKSISAYDMTVSDAIYGHSPRYVSRDRLETMLDYEYALLQERLQDKRGADTDFFVFADTVSARNFHGTNECHGWMGIKYQATPGAEPSQIVVHVRMLDKDNVSQQQALGIVGVNLIYGALFHFADPDDLMNSLIDDLTAERIEVDMIKFSGPEFRAVDHRLMSLKLVQLEPQRRGDVLGQRRGLAAVRGALQEADPGRARIVSPGHARQRRHAPLAHASSSSSTSACVRKGRPSRRWCP